MNEHPKILATIHFRGGFLLEKEFSQAPVSELAAKHYDENNAKDQLRIWLDHTKWIESGPNEFLPMSAVTKVTWTEIPNSQAGS